MSTTKAKKTTNKKQLTPRDKIITSEENLKDLNIIRPRCIKCQTESFDNFYKSQNKLHASECLPYCKRCLGGIFEGYMRKYEGDLKTSLYLTCRVADVPFTEDIADMAIQRIEKDGIENANYLDTYKHYFAYLNNKFRGITSNSVDVSFDDSEIYMEAIRNTALVRDLEDKLDDWKIDDEIKRAEEMQELKRIFGESYDEEELYWLKREYNDWEEGNDLDTVAKRKLTQDICRTRLNMRDSQTKGDANEISKYSTILKELLNQTGFKPVSDKGNVKNTTFGMTLKELEETRPADTKTLRDKYKDLDKNEYFFNNYYLAPMLRSMGIENSITEQMDREVAKYKLDENQLDFSGEEEVDDDDSDE